LGDGESALRAYRSVAESGHPLGVKAAIAMGHCYKRQKDWKQAMRLWEEVVRSGTYVPEEVYVELAKIYEHHVKDYEQALHCTLRAFDLWKKKSGLLRRKSKAEEAAYRKRIERLEQRLEQHA
jgi:tetratricopeptide (TPR) repeat protein